MTTSFDKPKNCYEAAARLISTRNNKAFLVHGTIFSTKLHRKVDHAWVESDGNCMDYAGYRRVILPIEVYYREGKATPYQKYSRLEALKMLKQTGTFKFWTMEERKKILEESANDS